MCGIGGRFNLNSERIPVREDLRSMAGILGSRGPDGLSIETGPGFGLVHTRLAIVDIPRGQQPFTSADGNILGIVNGEIYGHETLRFNLQQNGISFSSECDCEVVVHQYALNGIEGLKALRGEFAFAIIDLRSRRLILGCDPFRTKPLYWSMKNGLLQFSSDSRALISRACDRLEACLDRRALKAYLAYGVVPGGRSLFKDIHTLAPGQILSFGPDSTTPANHSSSVEFFRPSAIHSVETDQQTLRTTLEHSISTRLQGDALPGLWLSGGIDSGLLGALAARLAGQPLDAFTLGVDGPGYDERVQARATAKHAGLRLHETTFGIQHLEDLFPGFEACDTPLSDTAIHTTAALARFTKTKAILSGEGADELFGGYHEYQADRMAAWIPNGLLHSTQWLSQYLPSGNKRRAMGDALRRFSEGGLDPQAPHAWRWRRCISDSDLDALFVPDVLPEKGYRYEVAKQDPGATDLHTYLPDVLLPKADRAGLASGVEVRVPYLDLNVVEFARSLPFTHGKKMLRQVASNFLPGEVLAAPKRGFSAPVRTWLRSPAACDEAANYLLGNGAQTECLIHHEVLKGWLTEHETCRRDRHREIHALLCLEHWMRRERPAFATLPSSASAGVVSV